jgi:hypothetical protein
MLRWLRKLRRAPPPPPEARWLVAVDGESIRITDESGESRAVAKAELAGVAIETNDSGPWAADVWWLLFGAGDALACAFPMGATGEREAMDYLAGLQGFDHGRMIEAMKSTDNMIFPVWRRAPDAQD